MRILEVAVRDFRRLKECRVEFAPGATVIGGPNEAGKSTLAEAMHRALFLRARGTGAAWKEMQPVGGGTPQVEMRFQAHGTVWRLVKRFSGLNGTASLAAQGGMELRDDAAEAKLAELLGVAAAEGGKGGANEALKQWGHLWIWQGCSGGNPLEQANAKRDTILARLGRDGAAAVMQSELDGRVAARIAARHEEIFQKSGQPKAGSALARAKETAARAREEVARRREALERLAEAARTLAGAAAEQKRLDEALVTLKARRAELDVRSTAVEAATVEVNAHERKAEQARRIHEEMLRIERRIAQTRAEIAGHAQALVPLERTVGALEAEAAAARKDAEGAEIALRDAETRAREARLARELAEAWLARFEKAEEERKIEERLAQVSALRARRDTIEADLAKCPQADGKKLKSLRALDQARGIAEAELNAIAAGVELLAADLPVTAGDAPLSCGERRVFTAATEIRVGDKVRLRLSPGGGTGLAEQHAKVEDARRDFARALDTLGLPSLVAVEEAVERRRTLEKSRDEVRAALDALGEESIDRDLAHAGQALARAQAEVERRREAFPEAAVPPDLPAAREALDRARETAAEAESREKALRKVRQASAERSGALEKDLAARRGERDAALRTKAERDAILNDLLSIHGNDADRAARGADAAAASAGAEQALAAARERLAALLPESLGKDRERLDRALEQNADARGAALAAQSSAREQLRLDGSSDPHAALAFALERSARAGEAERREADAAAAVRMLHDEFREAARRSAEEYTAPLLDRIAGYLERLFGKGARAVLAYDQNEFAGLALHRPGETGTAFPFERLSGGAKEQSAAAVRLAVAEILAQGEEGALPVLFDDAFAYSDPERVATLQGMLDLACERGLQLIVLTCNPTHYASLGAKPVTLFPSSRTHGTPLPEHAAFDPAEEHADAEADDGTPPGRERAEPAASVHRSTGTAQPFSARERRLIDALAACGGKSGHAALREALDWDETTYDEVKEALLGRGILTPRKGRGGGVVLAG